MNLTLYKCENGAVWVSTERPDFETSILVVRNFTKEEVSDILEKWNFNQVYSIIDRVEKIYK